VTINKAVLETQSHQPSGGLYSPSHGGGEREQERYPTEIQTSFKTAKIKPAKR
jgi:hypothetical protein